LGGQSFRAPFKTLPDNIDVWANSIASCLNRSGKVVSSGSPKARLIADVKAYELYVRSAGLLASNTRSDLELAERLLEKAIEIDPGLAEAHGLLGFALWRRYFCGWGGDRSSIARALSLTNTAISLNPNSSVGRNTRIRLYWDLGCFEKGLKEALEIASAGKPNVESLNAIARAYLNCGMAQRTVELMAGVLQIEAQNTTALKLWIWSKLVLGDHEDVVKQYELYSARFSEDSNTAWAAAAALIHLKKPALARQLCERILRVDQSNLPLWVLLVKSVELSQNRAARARVCQRATETGKATLLSAKSNLRMRVWYALLLAFASIKEGKGEADAVSAQAPDNSYLLYRLVHVYTQVGETKIALEMFRRCIEKGFLSLQLLECEEIISLSPLVLLPEYQRLKETLKERIKRCSRIYTLASG
jgi:tetratricopeptide (TPR) repeat protein